MQTLAVAGVGRVDCGRRRLDRRRAHASACASRTAPGGRQGAGSGGNGPACFTERDDPMFKGTLIPTGIDSFETAVEAPFTRIVYGIIDSDGPPTAVTIVDRVTGTSAPVIEAAFSPTSIRAPTRRRDGRTLVAYDAAGTIVTAELQSER